MYSGEYKQVKETGSFQSAWRGFLKAMLIALGFTLLVFFLCALLLTYTHLPERAIPFIVTVTAVISVVIAGAVAAGTAGRRGYLNGAFMGAAYAFLLYLVSLLVSGDFYFGTYILILLAIGLFGGAFGGILGINLSGKHRR